VTKFGTPATSSRLGPETDVRRSAAGTADSWRPTDFDAVHDFLQLLARSVHQFHTYPHTSPLCVDAIAVCQRALTQLARERLAFRVTLRDLIVEDIRIGAGTVVEHELTRRLHRHRVARVEIDPAATVRDLTRFCADLIRCDESAAELSTLADRLAEHGVKAIDVRILERLEVLDVGAPTAPICDVVQRERSRRLNAVTARKPAHYLYPPDRGWIRLDPAASIDEVSLVDLPILVDEPADVASLLLRLTDDAPPAAQDDGAFERKFSDLARLVGAVEPRLARLLYAKLARAVLKLDPSRRQTLLRRAILPGLLDGRPDGAVLADFPDVDLADALCLLIDLETAAPNLLTAALERLDLPEERRTAVVPILESRLSGETYASGQADEPALDRYARKLIQVDAANGRSFAEFASYDLSMTSGVESVIAHVREAIAETDPVAAQLGCLRQLVWLQPDPRAVERLLDRAMPLIASMERADRWPDAAAWIARYRDVSRDRQESRPDVADAVTAALGRFCTVERGIAIGELAQRGENGSATAAVLIDVLGPAFAGALADAFDDPLAQGRARALIPVLCDHAPRLGPALARRLGHCGPGASRAIVRVLGFAGPGFEAALIRQLGESDEQTGREALRALARIGTPEAAAAVADQLDVAPSWARSAAEEALWHLPATQTTDQLRRLLGRSDFVRRRPDVVGRLLDRMGPSPTGELAAAVAGLGSLRLRLWNPRLVRLAHKARRLLQP
jgi:hypothetical protein